MNKRVYTAKMGMAEMMDSMFSLFTGHEESQKNPTATRQTGIRNGR
jgi:hypothetical protein